MKIKGDWSYSDNGCMCRRKLAMDFPKAKWGRGGTAAGGDLTSLTSSIVGPTGVNLVFSARGGLVRYYPPYNIIDSFAGFFSPHFC